MLKRLFGKRNRAKSQDHRVRISPVLVKRIGVAMSIAVTAIATTWFAVHALDRPIKHVEIEGKFLRVSPVQIEQAVRTVAIDGFLSIRLDAVQRAVAAVPWVDKVLVERSWPNSLRVRVVEHVPAARWGDTGLLNTRGELFLMTDARHIPAELPRLDGPPGSETKVAQLYLTTYPRLMAVGLSLTNVRLDPRGAWELALAHSVDVRLGRQDVEGRLERFIRIASPVIAPRLREISYVDMRYSNGFSVGWNPVTQAQPAASKETAPNA